MSLPSPGTAVGHPGPRSPRPAGPSSGTSPVPPENILQGIRDGPRGSSPPSLPRTRRRGYLAHAVPPRPLYLAGPPPRTPATSPTALPDLRRVPGESPATSPRFLVPSLPLEHSLPVPPEMLSPSTPPTSRRDPSLTRAKRYFNPVRSPRSRLPRRALPGVPRSVPPLDVLPPPARPSVSLGTKRQICSTTGSPTSPGPVGDDHRTGDPSLALRNVQGSPWRISNAPPPPPAPASPATAAALARPASSPDRSTHGGLLGEGLVHQPGP